MEFKRKNTFLSLAVTTAILTGCGTGSNPTVTPDTPVIMTESTTTAAASEPEEEEVIATARIEISEEYAELKETYDMNSGTIARVYNDYEVRIFRMEKDWYYCECAGMKGYIKAEYVRFSDKKTEPVTETTAAQTEATATKDIRVNEDLTQIDNYINEYAYVNVKSSLTMRSGPSTDYKKLCDLKKGDEVYVYHSMTNSRGYVWYYVTVNGMNGYILAKYVTFDYNEVFPDAGYDYSFDAYVQTKGSKLTLRDAPNGNAVTYIPNSEYVLVINTDNAQWWYICYNGTYGYASSEYLMPCGGIEKPVIYLYPEKETDVSIQLNLKGRLMFTYPEYQNGWQVKAAPDGTLTDSQGNQYSYIFWDGQMYEPFDFSSGFVVKGEDTLEFLTEKLEYMGLSENERNEFIVYWVPRMMNNPYNLISFQTENYEEMAKMTVSPKPDSMLRVFMAFQPLNEAINVPAQNLTPFTRKGFTLVEWGGAEVH
ncbi:MAG: SH3 domain-containing protein [Oscillospiraceae bacterium]|nr:SH3 domain-containing protein [Oscillospiraceae bacterium]